VSPWARRWLAALGLGLLAGALHFLYLGALAAEARGGEPVEVLVVSAPIRAGEPLDEARLGTREVPSGWVDPRAIPAARLRDVLGLAVSVDLEPGTGLAWTDCAGRLDPAAEDLARLVGPGERAMAIPVDGSLSLGGMLRPGHRVDILGTFQRGERRGERVTVTLLQNVTVLATGRAVRGAGAAEEARFRTVTLSVGMEESQLLAFATTQGSLSLVLRGQQDLEILRDVPEKGMDDVWEAERRSALQERSRRPAGIERLQAR
jgi:pilus assembly protein CpaB